MKELLDEHLQEEEQKAPRWYEKSAFYIYRKLYLRTFAVAACMLALLFFRDTLHIKEFIGSDLDAVLALIVLWAVMVHLFYKISQHVLTGSIMATILVFGVFLNYAPSVVAMLHGKHHIFVTHWRWSHYELVFGDSLYVLQSKEFMIRNLYTNIIESTEWLFFYILLTTITAEILGLGTKKK